MDNQGDLVDSAVKTIPSSNDIISGFLGKLIEIIKDTKITIK